MEILIAKTGFCIGITRAYRSVTHDLSKLGEGDRLVLGFHGLSNASKKDLATRGIDLVDDLIVPSSRSSTG